MAKPRLPEHLALLVGIHGMHHARLLSRDERPPPVREIYQNWRRSEIEVRSLRLGTAFLERGIPASHRESVAFGHLSRPEDSSSIEIQSKERIGGGRRRIRIAVPGGYINCALGSVDRGRTPHAGARGAIKLHSLLRLARRLRLLRDGVGRPDRFAGGAIEGRDATTEPAAGVVGIGPGQFFA